MASIWRRTMVYLGLVDDDEYDEYEPYDEPQPQSQPQAAQGRGRAARAVPEPVDSLYEPEPSGVRTLPRDEGVRIEPRGIEPRGIEPRGIEPRGVESRGLGGMAGGGMGSSGAVTVQQPQRQSVVRPFTQPQAAKVHVVVPAGFNDAQEIGDKLKDNQPVIVNLQGIDRDLSRRLIDFSSGLTYGLGGSMERVAEQVFLLTPSNVEVSPEEKRRLQERGLYRS
ncbi:MAG: cell division protein SepF [Actinomycetota bacterium]|nr:cell division protein SepF [Actinomycetota bacterium]